MLLLLLPFTLAAVPLSPPIPAPTYAFNTTWWNFTGFDAPLQVNVTGVRNLSFEGSLRGVPAADSLVETQLTYFSETWKGEEIRIHAYLYYPVGAKRLPGVVLAHGFGDKADSMAPFARDLARLGYATLAYSAPGQGNSTGPRNNQSNFARIETGPQDSWLARNIMAARRALSVLETLPEVDKDRLAFLGGSQGGITTFLTTALDPRVKAAVPVVASGDFIGAIRSGGAANFIAPGRVNANAPESVVLLSSYDVLGYAPLIRVPTLMLIGTDDEFFPLPGAVKTYEALAGPRAIDLLPNAGHAGEEDWNLSAYLFLEQQVRNGTPLPRVTARVEPLSIGGARVTATAPGAERVRVAWRDDLPGSRWALQNLTRAPDGTWEGEVPRGLTGQSVIVGAMEQGLQVSSTTPVRIPASPLSQGLVAALAAAVAFQVFRFRSRIREALKSNPAGAIRLAAGILFVAASLLPVLEFSGRVRVSLWQELRQFDHLLPTWLPYLALALVLLVPLLAWRRRRWAALLAVGGPALLLAGMVAIDLLSKGLVLVLPGGGLVLAIGAGIVLWRCK